MREEEVHSVIFALSAFVLNNECYRANFLLRYSTIVSPNKSFHSLFLIYLKLWILSFLKANQFLLFLPIYTWLHFKNSLVPFIAHPLLSWPLITEYGFISTSLTPYFEAGPLPSRPQAVLFTVIWVKKPGKHQGHDFAVDLKEKDYSKDGFIQDQQRIIIQGLQPLGAMCKFLQDRGQRTLLKRGKASGGACMLSHFSRVLLFVTPCTVACRLLCPWDSSGKNTGVGCHALLQRILLTHVSRMSCFGKRVLYH